MAYGPRLALLMVLAMELAGCTSRPTRFAQPRRPTSVHQVQHARRTPAHDELSEAQKEALFRRFSDQEAQREAGSSEAGK